MTLLQIFRERFCWDGCKYNAEISPMIKVLSQQNIDLMEAKLFVQVFTKDALLKLLQIYKADANKEDLYQLDDILSHEIGECLR